MTRLIILLPTVVNCVFLFMLGAVIGSFLNVCIHRIPLKEGFWESLKGLGSPPSRCPKCFNRISMWDNIPVFGWLKLRGRCRNCNVSISPRYPLIELANGLLFVAFYLYEIPPSLRLEASPYFFARYWPMAFPAGDWLGADWVLYLRLAYHLVLVEALLVATFIDFDLRIIPDGVTLPAMAVGLIGGLAVPELHIVPLWFQSPALLAEIRQAVPTSVAFLFGGSHVPDWFSHHPHLHGFAISVVGLLAGGGVVWGVRAIGYHVLRREAMGFGDVILMAMIGSFLGWQATLVVFFIAPACALVVVALCWIIWRDREIPYGPYLSLATVILLLGWQEIWPAAERIFSLGIIVIGVLCAMAMMLLGTLYVLQGFKLLLGIPLYEPEWTGEWTSSDQLAFLAGENVDEQQGKWATEVWPGLQSGRGRLYEQAWRGKNNHHQGQRMPFNPPRPHGDGPNS